MRLALFLFEDLISLSSSSSALNFYSLFIFTVFFSSKLSPSSSKPKKISSIFHPWFVFPKFPLLLIWGLAWLFEMLRTEFNCRSFLFNFLGFSTLSACSSLLYSSKSLKTLISGNSMSSSSELDSLDFFLLLWRSEYLLRTDFIFFTFSWWAFSSGERTLSLGFEFEDLIGERIGFTGDLRRKEGLAAGDILGFLIDESAFLGETFLFTNFWVFLTLWRIFCWVC